MRGNTSALLCVVAGVLLSCSREVELARPSVVLKKVVPANHVDTWTALESVLEDSGYAVKVTVLGVTADKNLPAGIVATHEDGTMLDIKLVAQDATGGTKVSITETNSRAKRLRSGDTSGGVRIIKGSGWSMPMNSHKVFERLTKKIDAKKVDSKKVDGKNVDVKKVDAKKVDVKKSDKR